MAELDNIHIVYLVCFITIIDLKIGIFVDYALLYIVKTFILTALPN